MKIIDKDNKYFPPRLREIKECPLFLYTEGNLDLLTNNSIAIIGSRNASEKGKKIAEKFSKNLSQVGLTIVSGLALGIDTVAHSFSYNEQGKTIAVLGGGFNKIFPPENEELYNKILENDGLVISEYSPDTEYDSSYFPLRNRIISGLSLRIFVVEAKHRSGTSITAKYAREQNRPVFALPHEIDDPHGKGTNRLLKKGGHVVTDPIDILEYLNLNRLKTTYLKLEDCKNTYKKDLSFSDPKQAKIFKLITEKPTSPNDLAKKTGYSINKVQSILFILEIDGYIKKVPGGYICM